MNIFFHNTGQSFITASYFEKEDISSSDIVELSQGELYLTKKNTAVVLEVEQLQTNVLKSLNYASNQKLLPSTLPEQLNIKFLNVSKLDKLKDRIIQSPIAQLESPNTMYVSIDLLPQNQTDSNKNWSGKFITSLKENEVFVFGSNPVLSS